MLNCASAAIQVIFLNVIVKDQGDFEYYLQLFKCIFFQDN